MKKSTYLTLILLIISGKVSSHEISLHDSAYYVQRYEKIIKVGEGLTVCGIIIDCIGATLLISGAVESERDTSSYFFSMPGLGKCIAGFIILSTGGVITLTGIPIWITGKVKSKNINLSINANKIIVAWDF